jgi:hypothetical protein
MNTVFSVCLDCIILLLCFIFPLGLTAYYYTESTEIQQYISLNLMRYGGIYCCVLIGGCALRSYRQEKSQQEYSLKYRQFRLEQRRMQDARRNGQGTWNPVETV